MSLCQNQLNLFQKNSSLKEITTKLSFNIKSELKVNSCTIFILEKYNVYTLETSTLNPLLSRLIHLNIDTDAIGKVVKTKEAQLIKNSKTYAIPSILQSLSTNSLCCIYTAPIIQQGNVIGLISIQNIRENSINESTQTALTTICANISSSFKKELDKEEVNEKIETALPQKSTIVFSGKGVTPGASIGIAIAAYNIVDIDSIPNKLTQNDHEVSEFTSAVKNVSIELKAMAKTIESAASKDESALFEAYTQIMFSDRFYNAIIKQIDSGIWVQSAIKNTVNKLVATFQTTNDAYLKERASDLKDIARRILLQLSKKPQKCNFPINTILISHEITPSMLAEVPKGHLKAIISENGTENSHAAILARAIGIPFILGFESLPISYLDRKEIIVDASIGKIYIHPSTGLLKAYKRLLKHEQSILSKLQTVTHLPSETIDHKFISIQANVGLVADLDNALKNNAKGIGLYRTEIPFMTRDNFPSEEEQRIIYTQFMHSYPNDLVTIRILDVGADKSLPYFSIQEENPALGWRGIRIMLDQEDLFLTQIRAMIRASEKYNNLKILLPMITEVKEVRKAIKLIKYAYKELSNENYSINMPKIGVMIEVPAIVFQLESIIKDIDFISIGSNDLTQYLMAIDRNNQKVSNLYNQLHPSMIQIFKKIADIANTYNVDLSICGEIATNPIAIPLLLGLGIATLSMNSISIPQAKWIIRHIYYSDCQALAIEVLQLSESKDIEKKLIHFFNSNQLHNTILINT